MPFSANEMKQNKLQSTAGSCGPRHSLCFLCLCLWCVIKISLREGFLVSTFQHSTFQVVFRCGRPTESSIHVSFPAVRTEISTRNQQAQKKALCASPQSLLGPQCARTFTSLLAVTNGMARHFGLPFPCLVIIVVVHQKGLQTEKRRLSWCHYALKRS